MTLVIPPGFGNAALVFTGPEGTQPFVTTIGVDLSSASGDFVGAANQVGLAFAGAFAPRIDENLTLDRVTLAVGSDGPGGSVDSTFTPEPMLSDGTYGPMAQAVIMRKVTNELGRAGRGRMFIPGSVPESTVGPSGELSPAHLEDLNECGVTFLANLTDDVSFDYSLPAYLLHSNDPVDPTPIEVLAASQIIGLVRGRIR